MNILNIFIFMRKGAEENLKGSDDLLLHILVRYCFFCLGKGYRIISGRQFLLSVWDKKKLMNILFESFFIFFDNTEKFKDSQTFVLNKFISFISETFERIELKNI